MTRVHTVFVVSLDLSLFRIATQDVNKSLVVLEPQSRSLDYENTQKVFIYLCKRSEVPGTTSCEARTKSAIKSTQTSGYVKA